MIYRMAEGILSQEEINALFNQTASKPALSIDDYLSSLEQDALGEIGNISLGSSTTALSTLLNQRVEITTPILSVIEQDRMEEVIEENHVAVHVDYTVGIRGKNLFMIKEKDAKIIASLMMGGDGTQLDEELSELHLSAVQEAMNQMMGSAATSMSTIFNQKVDISPPFLDVLGFPPKQLEDLEEEIIIEVSFRLKVGDLIDSNMIQFIPLSFAKDMINKILGTAEPEVSSPVQAAPMPDATPVAAVHQTPAPSYENNQPSSGAAPIPSYESSANSQSSASVNANVQKVEFTNFSESSSSTARPGTLDMLFDIPLGITVELGRTEMKIRKILELGPGAVIQLDKLAGEPVDILANHKLIARGEVVVIEENFGVRITDIISPGDRLSKMTN
jgi:flagellar motor switch protein FliN